jgi:hypothetical protein
MAMGHKGAEKLSVVDHMMKEIDLDGSGFITEPEFIRYLQKTRFEELAQRLKNFHQTGTVRVIEYGLDEVEYYDTGLLDMENPDHCERLGDLLQKPSRETMGWSSGTVRRWFDINGFQEDTMTLIANLFGLHDETMKDCGIYQRQKMEVLAPPGDQHAEADPDNTKRIAYHASMVVHLLTLEEKKNSLGNGRVWMQVLSPPSLSTHLSPPSHSPISLPHLSLLTAPSLPHLSPPSLFPLSALLLSPPYSSLRLTPLSALLPPPPSAYRRTLHKGSCRKTRIQS